MKSYLPFLSLVLVFASCTTAYKTGQTPDDVYFSPTRPQDEYVKQDDQTDEKRYRGDEEYRDDRTLRMRVRDRRWSTLEDNSYYSYHPYYNNYLYNTPWNSVSYWNYYYNPYCCCNTTVIPTKAVAMNTPRKFNLNVYNTPASSQNVKGYKPQSRATNTSTRSTSSEGFGGGLLRTIFGGGSSSGSSSSGSSESGSVKGSSSGSSTPPPSSSRGNAKRS